MRKIGIILCRDLKIPILYNGSKIDRSFSYSKIDKALNGNNQSEYQRQYEPHHMQISHFENKENYDAKTNKLAGFVVNEFSKINKRMDGISEQEHPDFEGVKQQLAEAIDKMDEIK